MARPIYEKRTDETDKQFAAFCTYRNMGAKRTLAKAAELDGRKATAYLPYSNKYEWVKRAAEWDAEQDRIATKADFDALYEMRKRHAKTALMVHEICDVEFKKILKATKKLKKKGTLHPDTLARLLKESTTLERITYDQPDSIQKTQVEEEFDYSQLDVEDIRQLRRIKKKAKKKTESGG